MVNVYDMYLRFCVDPDMSIKTAAVKGLIYLFGRRPRFLMFPEAKSIIHDCMDPKRSIPLCIATLNGLRDFLESEEERICLLQKQELLKKNMQGLKIL